MYCGPLTGGYHSKTCFMRIEEFVSTRQRCPCGREEKKAQDKSAEERDETRGKHDAPRAEGDVARRRGLQVHEDSTSLAFVRLGRA